MAAIERVSDQQAVVSFAEGDGSPKPLCFQESGGSNATSLCAASTGGSSKLSLAMGKGARGASGAEDAG